VHVVLVGASNQPANPNHRDERKELFAAAPHTQQGGGEEDHEEGCGGANELR